MLHLDLTHWRIGPKDTSLLSSLGISPDKKIKEKLIIADSFFNALTYALQTVTSLLLFFIVMLERVVTGALPFTLLLGPLGFLKVTALSFIQGLSVFSMFVATLSLAVAIVNILPIPGLDGGSIVYVWLEKLRGKPMSIAMEILLYRLAVIIFVILLINLTMNDIQRYFS